MPGNPPGPTEYGDARAPPVRAPQPVRLLRDPAQGPLDCLLQRLRRGRFRLPHVLHHRVLSGGRSIVAGRRPPPRGGRRLGGRERGAPGIYSDRRGRKGLLLIGSAILPPSILVFALTTDVKWMVLAALVAGVGEGAFLSSWNAIIADQTTVEQRNAAFALSFVLNN